MAAAAANLPQAFPEAYQSLYNQPLGQQQQALGQSVYYGNVVPGSATFNYQNLATTASR